MAVERTIIEWQLHEDSREKLRIAVLMKWASEKCGNADAYKRYRYNVEQLPNGGVVYLHRPAFLNKGCDFVVNCDPAISRDDGKKFKNPRHQDLISELKWLSEQITDGKARVVAAVNAVWMCQDATATCDLLCYGIENTDWKFRAERALKVAKWFFIEQDITDWNTSGRDMLMRGINKVLVL